MGRGWFVRVKNFKFFTRSKTWIGEGLLRGPRVNTGLCRPWSALGVWLWTGVCAWTTISKFPISKSFWNLVFDLMLACSSFSSEAKVLVKHKLCSSNQIQVGSWIVEMLVKVRIPQKIGHSGPWIWLSGCYVYENIQHLLLEYSPPQHWLCIYNRGKAPGKILYDFDVKTNIWYNGRRFVTTWWCQCW